MCSEVHLPSVSSRSEVLLSLLVMTEYNPGDLELKQRAPVRMPAAENCMDA